MTSSGQGVSTLMVLVVTGANTGIGFGIVQRLLIHHRNKGSCPTIIMACRNLQKAQDAKNQLLDEFFPSDGEAPFTRNVGIERLAIITVDLGCVESVFKACKQIKTNYDRIDMMILNAGFMPIEKIDLMLGIKNLITRPSYVAKTGGDTIVQRKGLINADGLGECFAANVFGHWIMVRELSELVRNSNDGKVVWFSSTTADPMFFDAQDFQAIKSDHPYEACKRLCELLSFHLSQTAHIQSFVCSPGNVLSNITQGSVNVWLMLFALYMMRIFFCSGINITPQNGSSSAIYLHETAGKELDPLKLYHSDITPFGKTWVKKIDVEYEDIKLVVDKMDELVFKFKRKYMAKS